MGNVIMNFREKYIKLASFKIPSPDSVGLKLISGRMQVPECQYSHLSTSNGLSCIEKGKNKSRKSRNNSHRIQETAEY